MEREILFSITKKDLNIETMRSSKPGGQRGDKVETAVRITHPDSGAVGYSQDQRNQADNKRIAFRRLVESEEFVKWLTVESAKYHIYDTLGVGVTASEEVIRTYHIKRGTVLDHRSGKKYNLRKFMDGNR